MRRKFITACLLVVAAMALAIPAKRGLWSTITLTDGTRVRAELRGGKAFCFMQDADGNKYVRNDTATYRLITEDEIETRQSKKHVKHAPSRACYASTSDGLGEYGKMSMGAVPSIGSYTIPVIMVQFSDAKFKSTTTVEKMTRYYNQEGYAEEEGCVGSVRDYFKSQSHGMFVPTFDVVGIVTLDESYVTYGNDSDPYESIDDNIDQLPRDAVAAAVDQLGVDFSRYIVQAGDANHKDGVPLVCILYAGKGQATESETTANSKLIWPCEWDCDEDMSETHFNSWFVGNESVGGLLSGIGTFCHEFGHALGLPDFYCTNYGYENDDPFSDWSIMDTGSYVEDGYAPIGYTAYEKSYMGWLKLIELDGDGEKTLQSPADAGEGSAFIIRNSDTETFILENRQPGTWYPTSSHGSGLMLSRIAYNGTKWNNNTLNNTQNKKRAMIVTANGAKLYYSSSQANLYGNGVNSITSLKLYGGSTKTVSIKNITKNSDGTINFTYGDASSSSDDPVVTPTGDYLFYESFDKCNGKGGNDDLWSGSIATAAFKADNEGWSAQQDKYYGANKCARFGTGSVAGVATTPSFTVNGTTTLTFKAAPWSGDGSTLTLSVSNGSITPSQVTMTADQWSTFTATITGTGVTSVTFTPSKRFFLDEVLAVDPSTTGINEVRIADRTADGRIYSIDGRFVGTDFNVLRPGIYIVNGKKVVR